MNLGHLRLESQRLLITGHRAVQLHLRLKRVSQVAVDLGHLRLEEQRPLKAGHCFIQSSLGLQDVAEIDVRLGQIRLEGQGPLEARRRFLQPALSLKNGAQVHLRFGQVRLESQRPPITVRGFHQVALRLQDGAQVGMIGGLPVVGRDRRADQFGGDVVAADLVRQRSEQVQAVRMAGLDGQNLAVDSLGVGQPALLVVLDGILQHSAEDRNRL